MESIYNRLREYVDIDRVMGSATPDDEKSDFDLFCEQHCDDISTVLDCLYEINSYIDELDENNFDKTSDYEMVKAYLKPIKDLIKKVD